MRYKFKTGTAAALVLAFILTMFSFTYPAAAENSDNSLGEAKVLEALGIISGTAEEFVKKETITRQEAAELMVKMSGANEAQLNEKNPNVYFKDVDDKSEFAPYIKAALEMGIINGNGDYTFEPNKNVTYTELLKMAVVVLGYDTQAKLQGGYPSGYLQIASRIGLKLSSVSEPIDGGLAAELLYSMLDAKYAYMSTVGDNITYSTDENKTLLTENLKVYKTEGILNGTKDTELYGKSSLTSGEILIDGTEYKYDGNASELLGKEIEAYYKDEKSDGEKRIIYIAETDRNRVITCDAEDISLSGMTFTYYDERDKKKTVNLSGGAAIIYNERAVTDTSFDFSKIVPSEGSVTLIDNNSDGTYEVVKVSSYIDVVVESADTHNYVIYDKYLTNRDVNLKDGSKTFDYEILDAASGKTIDIDKLAEYDVLSVMKSDDNSFYILKSNKLVTGKIEKIEEDSEKVFIGGTEYKVSKSYRTSNQKSLAVGDSGTFLLDVYGRIAGIKSVSSAEFQVGLVTNLSDGYNGMSANPRIEIYTVLGEKAIFYFANKVKIDGVRLNSDDVKNGESVVASAINRGGEGYSPEFHKEVPSGQLIRYKIDNDKKISEVDTSYKNSEAGEDGNTLTRSIDYKSGNGLYYKIQGKNFGGKELASDSTIVFGVSLPLIGNDESDYKISSGGSFSDNNYYNIESYTYTDDKIGADVIICYNDSSKGELTQEARDMLVDSFGEKLGKDESVKKTISGWCDGSYTTIAVSDSVINNVTKKYNREIKQGDYINFSTNSADEMNIIDLVYDSNLDKFTYGNRDEFVYANGSGDFGEGYRYAYGLIYRRFGKDIVMSRTFDKSKISDISLCDKLTVDTSNIYVYDKNESKDKVRIGTMAELIPYTRDNLNPSRVVVRTSYARVVDILIIK